MRRYLVSGLVAVIALGAAAQTYEEFMTAVRNAADDDTVWVENDLEFTSALPQITKRITIASSGGRTNVLKRAAGLTSGSWLSLVDASAADADITLRDVIVDGNREAGSCACQFARMKAGKLTLDAGTTVRNFDWTGRGLGISATAVVDMNEGAAIRDCRYADWGMFLVGRVESSDRGGTFNMNGGLITGCVGCGNTAQNGYDGVLYVYYGGRVNLRGGTITGNLSQKATAGVVVYNDGSGGGLWLSGTASVTNNVGGLANDIWIYASARVCLAPDYAGRATLWNGTRTTTMDEPVLGKSDISGLYRETGTGAFFSGAGNISCQGHPDVVADGYFATESERLVWGRPTFEVGGRLTCVTMQEALDKSRSGEMLCLLEDIVDGALTFTNAQNFVLSGRGARGFRLTSSTTISTVLNLRDGATVKLVDMVVDGGGDVRGKTAGNSLFSVGTNCVLTLGKGTTVRNVKTSNWPAVAALVADRARLVMEDGALITDCEDVRADGWGFLLRVGQLSVSATYDDRPCFEMRGGLITGNRAATTSAASDGYGGMVYIQNGRFVMTGGTITGNSCGTESTGSCAGVQLYAGADTAGVWISGTARIVGNVGKNPDVYRTSSRIHLFGDFRGRVGISSGKQGKGKLADVVVEDGATGAWGLFPAATTAEAGLVGSFVDGSVRWTDSTGSVDGEAVATANDALECWSARNTVALDEAGLAGLPHVFAGSALAIDGTLTLDFDPIAMQKDPRLPIRLLKAQDGALTGDWTFNLPAFDRSGVWEVSPVRENGDIVAYDLVFRPPGAVLIIR